MACPLIKAVLSGLRSALACETARRFPGFGARIMSLPLVSCRSCRSCGFGIWLWRGTRDVARLADHAIGALWFLAPSVPMFFTIPMMPRAGWGFSPALGAGCVLTIVLHGLRLGIGPRFGLKLQGPAPSARPTTALPRLPSPFVGRGWGWGRSTDMPPDAPLPLPPPQRGEGSASSLAFRSVSGRSDPRPGFRRIRLRPGPPWL